MTKKFSRRIVPLAFDEDGNPLAIPEEAHFFRLKVRRGSAKRHQLVCGKAGTPMLVPVDVLPEDFQEQVGPGIYKLELVDENGYTLEGAPTLKYIVERDEEEDDPGASRAEAFVSKLLKEQRLLVTRLLDYIEHQSTEQAGRSAEHSRLLATQVERFERAMATLADKSAQTTTAMLEQNTKLVTVMANKFGDYIAEATNLLAAHPAAGKPASAADIVSEHKHIRNAVADLAETHDEDNPLLSLLDKSLDSALPVLAPALQRVIHRVFGLDERQSDALSGVPSQPALAQGSASTQAPQLSTNGQPTSAELARVMDVLNHLTVPERAAAMAVQQAMSGPERDRLRAELVALPTAKAVVRVRQILAEREREGHATDPQAHLRAVLALLAKDEQDATQELLDALSPEKRTRWRAQILSRSPSNAAVLIRSQLTELAAAMPMQTEATQADATQADEGPKPKDNESQP